MTISNILDTILLRFEYKVFFNKINMTKFKIKVDKRTQTKENLMTYSIEQLFFISNEDARYSIFKLISKEVIVNMLLEKPKPFDIKFDETQVNK